jgi:hypothetical protein
LGAGGDWHAGACLLFAQRLASASIAVRAFRYVFDRVNSAAIVSKHRLDL